MNKQEVYQFLKDNNIQTEDLIKILKENGNEINMVKIDYVHIKRVRFAFSCFKNS